MPSFVPLDPETVEDQQRYTQARLVEVACQDCLAVVRVKKNSDHHPSIQWSESALKACAEFARMEHEPKGRAVHAPCQRLIASIDKAAREGQITIGAEDGY